MSKKPSTADGYTAEMVELVHKACLYMATRLGDLLDDIVIVGGLVPSLLVDPKVLGEEFEKHAGTMDLDLGLSMTLLKEQRYVELADRLRQAGFRPDQNAGGNITRQRWVSQHKITVDFLIAPSPTSGTRPGRLQDLEKDFAAIITPGLNLAFQDRQQVTLTGQTLLEETATRQVWVCGAGAFVILKALAFLGRGENKDAYDLFYILQNLGTEHVSEHIRPLLGYPEAQQAIEVLRMDFLDPNGTGPSRVSQFFGGGPDPALQADVSGYVRALLAALGELR